MKLKLETLQKLHACGYLLGIGVFVAGILFLMNAADSYFGFRGRLIAGGLGLLLFLFVFIRYNFRICNLLDGRERAEAREKYRGIYRVLALPTASKKPANWCDEEITIGDYGWESKPLSKDGLIWLHGLSIGWGHVWRAGFQPDQVEYVGPKPVSQFDWKDFEYDGPKPTACYQWPLVKPKNPCPFPIQKAIANRRLQFPITCA